MLPHFNNLKNCYHELSRLSSMDNCTAEALNATMLTITPSSVDHFMIKDVLNALYLAQKEITLVAPYLGLFIVNAQGKCLFELMNWNIYLVDNKFSVQPKGMAEIVASLAAVEKSASCNERNERNERRDYNNREGYTTGDRPARGYNNPGRGGYNNRGDSSSRGERSERSGRGGRSERGGYFPREPRGAEPTNFARNTAYAIVTDNANGTNPPSVLERINQSRPDPRANAPVSKYDKNKERNAAKKMEKKSNKKDQNNKNETKNLPNLSDTFLTEMLSEITKEHTSAEPDQQTEQ